MNNFTRTLLHLIFVVLLIGGWEVYQHKAFLITFGALQTFSIIYCFIALYAMDRVGLFDAKTLKIVEDIRPSTFAIVINAIVQIAITLYLFETLEQLDQILYVTLYVMASIVSWVTLYMFIETAKFSEIMIANRIRVFEIYESLIKEGIHK